MRRPWWILAGLALVGVALAEGDTALDSADTGDTALPADSEPLDSGAFLDTAAPPSMDSVDTGDSGDTGLAELPCAERGLFVGDLTFSTSEALSAWAAEYAEVSGSLRLVGIEDLVDLSSLECLRSAQALEIEGMPALQSVRLQDFDTSRLSLVGNPALEDVELALTEASLVVADNPALRQLDVRVYVASGVTLDDLGGAFIEVDDLVLVEGDLRMTGLGGSIDLGRLTRVDGDVLLRGLAVRDLRSLSKLVHVGGGLEVVEMPGLVSLEGPEVARYQRLAIVKNPALVSLNGLEEVVEIETLTMSELPALRDLSGLDGLRRVGTVEGERRYRKLLQTE